MALHKASMPTPLPLGQRAQHGASRLPPHCCSCDGTAPFRRSSQEIHLVVAGNAKTFMPLQFSFPG